MSQKFNNKYFRDYRKKETEQKNMSKSKALMAKLGLTPNDNRESYFKIMSKYVPNFREI